MWRKKSNRNVRIEKILLTKRKVDIACIQKPAIRYGKLMNVSAVSTSIFHNKNSIAEIVMFNSNMIVIKVTGTDMHLVTIEVQLNRKGFYVINQYSDPIEDHVSKLTCIS